MSRREYLEMVKELYDSGKISAETYDILIEGNENIGYGYLYLMEIGRDAYEEKINGVE